MTSNTRARLFGRSGWRLILAVIVVAIPAGFRSMRPLLQAQTNPIVQENTQAGSPSSEWDISGAGDPSIQGFATDISINRGEEVSFKVNTDATSYILDIYRLGYYANGAGARKYATLTRSTAQTQPACRNDAHTGLSDCGNWAISATWAVPATATSGIYVVKLTRTDTGGSSHIVFVVRDDARQADVVVQTSDTTWQAYNRYGGGSLYCNGPFSNAGTIYGCAGRATQVSYNRPMDTRDHDPQSFLFNAEYPMVRWLEANGYDVKYISGVDTERHAADLVGPHKPKAFFSVGHDEYWSYGQRASVEAARSAGVNLAFFSGNEMYWKSRWERSEVTFDAYRTLICYKETMGGTKLDPALSQSTGTWRDTRFGEPTFDGGRPENGLTGNLWTVNSGTAAITVPAAMANLRLWRNTRVADLTSGVATLGSNTLGYEWDEDIDNGARPNGLIHLSSTTIAGVEKILDFGETIGVGTATHSLTLYRHGSGALVFGAGTVQWAWGLDSSHDRGAAAPDQAMQQATVNLLADMGAQPGSLQIGADPARPLVASGASADTVAPTSIVSSPAAGEVVGTGDRVMITGTASDSGGVVAGVEVSVDGGTTWHPATGRATWTYDWHVGPAGTATIKTRATDDSGNQESAGAGISVTIGANVCPCPNLWKPTTVPSVPDVDDPSAVELGVKFRSDVGGFVKGVRFYKSLNNNGTHIGSLWSSTGTPLATVTFAGESPSGWQEMLFDVPVLIGANTTYVVSYHTNVGHYAASSGYFATLGQDAAPLHAGASAAVAGNGVFLYGTSAFPTSTYNASNYWVDVVFDSTPDTTAPVMSNVAATPVDASVAVVTWTTNEPSTSRVDYSTSSAFAAAQTLSVSDPAKVRAHSMRLTGLSPSTQYFFRVRSTDLSGNEASTTLPDGVMMPSPTLRDTLSADFGAGTSTGTYVAETGDGELILAPGTATEFSGTTMPTGWVAGLWGYGGSATIAGGRLTADGARVATCVDVGGVCQEQSTLLPPASMEFVATFTGDPYQHSGFGQNLGSYEPFALFSTSWTDDDGVYHDGGALGVRTNDNGTETRTALGVGLLGVPHRYRIDWQETQVVYSVDGVQVAAHPVVLAGPMHAIVASDYHPYTGIIVVDWVRTLPYAAAGSFRSRVYDAGAAKKVAWTGVEWTGATPEGTSLAITVCTSQTLASDGSLADPSCSPAYTSSPQTLTPVVSRYVQYRADLTSSDPLHSTPELSDIKVNGALLVVPQIAWPAPAAIVYGTPLGAVQLNATTDAPSTAGTLSYAPPAGTVLTTGPHTLSVTFVPSDPTAYDTATASVAITVNKATPTISWQPPGIIPGGTALSATQLNATASVPGTFVYTPGSGVVLPSGPANLSLTFTPTDTANYTTATMSVPVIVVPTISMSSVSMTEGNVVSGTKQAVITVTLSQDSSAWVSVNYATSDGTATSAGGDYLPATGTVYFAPGVRTQTISIQTFQDTLGEFTESFFVDFSGAVNGLLLQAQPRSTVTLLNDDSSNEVFSTTADLAAGTLGAGAYISDTSGGELMLTPQGSEFSGSSLPAGWTSTLLVTDGSSTVANGTLVINGAALVGPTPTTSGQTLDFNATFGASPEQRVGFATSSAPGAPTAMFVVSGGELLVRTMKGTTVLESQISGVAWLGQAHRYQITWNATNVQYLVDGFLMMTHSVSWGTVAMRPVIVDPTTGNDALTVNWIRSGPYALSGTFTSAVFDATDPVLWQKLTTSSTIPSGTTSTVTYRTGTTPVPDESWTPFTAPGTGGALVGTSRFVQFAIAMTSTSTAKTPVVQSVTIQFKR